LSAAGIEEQLLVSGKDPDRGRHRPASETVAWLRKALVAVVCAVLGHVPVHVLVALVICLTAALLFVSSESARAEVTRLVPDGQFESQQALGVAVDNSCTLQTPPLTGEACTKFDSSAGDIYATGFLNVLEKSVVENKLIEGRINKFDGSGKLLAPPSPFAEPGAYAGAAVNPASGDVYALKIVNLVTFSFEPTVEILDPVSGALVGSFPVEPSGNYQDFGGLTVVGIAADSEGNVYVPVAPKNEVLEYDPTTCVEEQAKGEPPPCKPLKTFTGGLGSGALKGPTGVAIDPAGNLWVADTGNSRIEELSPADEPVPGGEIPSEGVGSVAVDAHGDVFAIVDNSRDFCGAIKSPCSHLVEYDSAGAQVGDFGASVIGAKQFGPEFGSGRNHTPVPDMVAVSDVTGEVYVSEAVASTSPGESTGRVLEYRSPVAPVLEGESAVEVGASAAKLGAVVSPGGLDAAYRFEYLTAAAYAADGESFSGPDAATSVPFPEGDTGAGFVPRTVWAGVSGLEPGTTYHYRVVVTGALGEPVVGGDQTFTTRAATGCPNEALRTGFSASLPDCRAYELVTPPNKDSAQPDKNQGGNSGIDLFYTLGDNRAAADAEGNGNGLVFRAEDVLPGSLSAGKDYVATRGSGGWSSQNVYPPTDYYGFKCPEGLEGAAFSEDLSKTIVKLESAGQPCGVDPELVSGEPAQSRTGNLFVRDNATGAYQLIDVTPEGVAPATPSLLGESSDFSRIVFSQQAPLTPGAPTGAADVYEWSDGHVQLVTVLPDGAPVVGSFAGISADGSRVFFTAGGDLYARVDGSETVQLDASQAGGAGGGGAFLKASHDGSVVLFSADASAGLTSDTVPGSGTNLYRYDFNAPSVSRLTDLTPVAHAVSPAVSGISKDGSIVFFTDEDSAALTSDTVPGSGTNLYRYEAASAGLTDLTPVKQAEVQSVLGVSEDGSSVYFSAKGVLPSQPNQHEELPKSGEDNLYLSHGGASAFIAWGAGHFQVSANGGFLLFESNRALTVYDNLNLNAEPATELYLYDAGADSLACASCNPSGERPTAFAIRGISHAGGPDSEGGAIEEEAGRVTPRQLSENGQVFFDSAEGLVPADTNGKSGCRNESGFPACTDVYEFEPDGVGHCAEPAGCLSLLSTGTGSLETFLVDASPNGDDVFIREFQKLVPRDTQDEAPSLYDVRVDGGFPEQAPPPPCTTPEACRTAPTPAPAIFGAPASQTFSGVGNLASPPPAVVKKVIKKTVKCKQGYVKKKSKCVKVKKAKKSAHTNHKTGR
jgi:NHL repeat